MTNSAFLGDTGEGSCKPLPQDHPSTSQDRALAQDTWNRWINYGHSGPRCLRQPQTLSDTPLTPADLEEAGKGLVHRGEDERGNPIFGMREAVDDEHVVVGKVCDCSDAADSRYQE